MDEVHDASTRLESHLEDWCVEAVHGQTKVPLQKLIDCECVCCRDLIAAILEKSNHPLHRRGQDNVSESVLSPLLLPCVPAFFEDLMEVIQGALTVI